MNKQPHFFFLSKPIYWVLGSIILVCTQACAPTSTDEKTDKKTNIVLIVADDLGFGDIGCFGGEIETPNIDALAASGIRFSHFHTAPMCGPTRAMLLSGNDNHIAGMGVQSLRSSEFGYEGTLTDRIIPVPALLKTAGYHTYMAGKWHLGGDSLSNPANKGFEKSYVMIEGAGNHYLNKSALNGGDSHYMENGKAVKWKDGDYSTDFYTDKLIEYIDGNKEDQQPFFIYASYTSPHWPLQVDEKYWKKYQGKYDEGYEALKLDRFERLKQAEIIPSDASMPPSHERVKPWGSLSEEEKKREARKMELYAGMVDNLDENIGRLIQHLKDINEFDNTLFVFMSDNGAGHRDFIRNENYVVLRDFYHNEYENMGKPDSYVSYGPQWAEAGAAPFRYFKDYSTQGGMNTTLIMSGPTVKRVDELHHGFTTVLDLAPTFYETANISYPQNFEGREVYPLRGNSLMPFLQGETNEIHDSTYVFALEHIGHAMLRKGKWKITNFEPPFSPESFKLYDISKDLGEQHDLKEDMPLKYAELMAEWEKFHSEMKIQPPKSFH